MKQTCSRVGRSVSAMLAASGLTACTTMGMLGEAKDSFGKGEIGWGLYQGTMGLIVGPVVDVFTLGGSLDANEAGEVWTTAANQYAATQPQSSASRSVTTNVSPALSIPAVAPSISSARPMDNNSYGTTNVVATSQDSSSTATVPSRPANRPNTAPFINASCVSIKQTGTGISDMIKTVTSKCQVPIQVLYCFEDKKKPGRSCLSGGNVGWGTTSTIRPGGSALVSDVPTSWTVHYAVCDVSNPRLLCVKPN